MTPLGLLGPLSQDWLQQNKVIGCPHPHVYSDHFLLLVELEMVPTITAAMNGVVTHRWVDIFLFQYLTIDIKNSKYNSCYQIKYFVLFIWQIIVLFSPHSVVPYGYYGQYIPHHYAPVYYYPGFFWLTKNLKFSKSKFHLNLVLKWVHPSGLYDIVCVRNVSYNVFWMGGMIWWLWGCNNIYILMCICQCKFIFFFNFDEFLSVKLPKMHQTMCYYKFSKICRYLGHFRFVF